MSRRTGETLGRTVEGGLVSSQNAAGVLFILGAARSRSGILSAASERTGVGVDCF